MNDYGSVGCQTMNPHEHLTPTASDTSSAQSCLEHEDYRISTFSNWPAGAARIDPRKVAKAGLFHADAEGEIRCSWCGFNRQFNRVEQDDEVILEHVSESPDCRFVASDSAISSMSERDTSESIRLSEQLAADATLTPTSAQLNTTGQQPGGTAETLVTSSTSPRCRIRESDSSGHEEGDTENDDCDTNPASNACTDPASVGGITPPTATAQVNSALHSRLNDASDSLKRESLRLLTFRQWPLSFLRPIDMARAGFVYTGERDYVRCVFCGEYVGEWNVGEDPMQEHRTLFANCPFVRGLSVGNVTIEDEAEDQNQPVDLNMPQHGQNSADEGGSGNTDSVNRADSGLGLVLNNIGYDETGIRDGYRDSSIEADPISTVGLSWKFVPLYRRTGRDGRCFYEGAITVAPGYSGPTIEPTPAEAAENLSTSASTAAAATTTSTSTASSAADTSETPATSASEMNDLVSLSSAGGINSHCGPAHSKHATLDARMRTFLEWPPALKQQPNALAEAGFFYTGKSDQVRCFYCDGGLRNWQPEDLPWVEHARWFSGCGFVRLIKGNEFIEKCMVSGAQSGSTDRDDLNESNESTSSSRSAESRTSSDLSRGGLNDTVPSCSSDASVQPGIEFGSVRSTGDVGPDIMSVTQNSRSQSENTVSLASSHPNSPERVAMSHSSTEVSKYGKADTDRSEDFQLEYNRLKEERLCKICYDQEAGLVFVPCGHLICCVQCAPALKDCPLCRKPIKGTLKTYRG